MGRYSPPMWIGRPGSVAPPEEQKRAAKIEAHDLDVLIRRVTAELQALEDRRRILESILAE